MGRVGAYRQCTLAGATGASPIFQVTSTRQNAVSRTNRELRDLSDEERPSNVLPCAACQ